MTSARLSVVLIALLCAAGAWGQLELASLEPLQVDFAGSRLIDGMALEPAVTVDGTTWPVEVEGWASVTHRWLPEPGARLRQEIAVRPDRFELTHLRLLDPGVIGVTSCGLRIPHEVFDGARCELIGSPRSAREIVRADDAVVGTLGPEEITQVRNLAYLRVHLPGGAVDFDCQPRGTWEVAPGVTRRAVSWTLLRQNDGWWLLTAYGKARVGTLHDFKLVVVPARPEPVAQVHPRVGVRWTDPYAATTHISFGAEAVDRYDTCAIAEATVTRDERWVGVQPARVEGAQVTGEARFVLPVERDGVYLVSLLVGDAEGAQGPCTVSAGLEPRTTLPVAPGEYGTWVLAGRSRDGELAVTITGECRVAAAQAAPMLFDLEDYLLDRGWWLSTEFAPEDDLPL